MAEVKIVRDKKRVKKTGEVFTPEIVSKRLVEHLKEQDFSKMAIDRACGDGNLLTQILKFKLQNGSTALEALQTTYGVDIMQDNVWECRRRLFEIAYSYDKSPTKEWKTALLTNIRCANTLEKSLEEIFTAPLDEVDTCPQV